MSFRKPLGRRQSSLILLVLAALGGVVCISQSSKGEQAKEVTAEQVAESTIAISGNGFGRAVLTQIRRNGLEVGKETRIRPDGKSEESRYEMRFVHGEKPEQDKIRVDSKTPQAEYTLVYGEGRLFGIINGATFTPRPDDAADFIAKQAHSIDALLRYKELESKLSSAGKDKQQGIDLYVIDLVDKANRKTRYFISAKTFRILSLEYEETPPGSSTAVKYTKRFYDYRLAQGTQVPYRTVTMEDGKLTMETHILTITFGVKMDEALFKNPSAASASGNP
jgi:outer membrane lipoprotein-sorting protein